MFDIGKIVYALEDGQLRKAEVVELAQDDSGNAAYGVSFLSLVVKLPPPEEVEFEVDLEKSPDRWFKASDVFERIGDYKERTIVVD